MDTNKNQQFMYVWYKSKILMDVPYSSTYRQKKNASNHSTLKGIKVSLADICSEIQQKH